MKGSDRGGGSVVGQRPHQSRCTLPCTLTLYPTLSAVSSPSGFRTYAFLTDVMMVSAASGLCIAHRQQRTGWSDSPTHSALTFEPATPRSRPEHRARPRAYQKATASSREYRGRRGGGEAKTEWGSGPSRRCGGRPGPQPSQTGEGPSVAVISSAAL